MAAAHAHGLAVFLDVVFNHLGPSDPDQWQFDGRSKNGCGGIYFYNDDRALTKHVGAGDAGCCAQWAANFVHPIRRAVISPQDEQRSLGAIGDAICHRDNDDASDRFIHSESHDEVESGKRVSGASRSARCAVDGLRHAACHSTAR